MDIDQTKFNNMKFPFPTNVHNMHFFDTNGVIRLIESLL